MHFTVDYFKNQWIAPFPAPTSLGRWKTYIIPPVWELHYQSLKAGLKHLQSVNDSLGNTAITFDHGTGLRPGVSHWTLHFSRPLQLQLGSVRHTWWISPQGLIKYFNTVLMWRQQEGPEREWYIRQWFLSQFSLTRQHYSGDKMDGKFTLTVFFVTFLCCAC